MLKDRAGHDILGIACESLNDNAGGAGMIGKFFGQGGSYTDGYVAGELVQHIDYVVADPPMIAGGGIGQKPGDLSGERHADRAPVVCEQAPVRCRRGQGIAGHQPPGLRIRIARESVQGIGRCLTRSGEHAVGPGDGIVTGLGPGEASSKPSKE